MAIKLVIDVDAVKQRMALPALADIDPAIESALVNAHLVIQGILETDLSPVSGVVETFYIDPDRFPTVPAKYHRCRLSRAFVKSASVELSDTSDGAVWGSVADAWVDNDRGIVHIPESAISNLATTDAYVRVTYAAGIDSGNPAPDWLKEAILAYMPTALNSQQTSNRSDEAEPMFKQNTKLAAMILEPHMRGKAFHYKAMK